jgi:hypothetical protein
VRREHWQDSKAWADQFTPHVQELLGIRFFRPATRDQDLKENTDLLFESERGRFAIRIRRLQERLAFNRRNEVTLRLKRTSGQATELGKLMNGLGDYFLYGWGDERSQKVVAYSILNLAQLRGWLFEVLLETHKLPGQCQDNHDGSSSFVAFCLDCMPPHLIVSRHTHLPGDPANTDPHWLKAHAAAQPQQGVFAYAQGAHA